MMLKLPYGIANFEALGEQVSREEIRTYYNGYRFSPNADQTVYNNDMILHYASERLLKGLSNRDYQQFDEKYIKTRAARIISIEN